MDLIIIFKILFKKKWLILGISFITAVTTLLASYQLKPKYISAAQLSTGFTTNDKIQVVDDKFNIRDAGIKFNNLIKTMESELVMSLLTYRLIIHDWTSETPFKEVDFEDNKKVSPPSNEEIKKYLGIIEQKYNEKELLSSYDPTEFAIIELLRAYGYLNWQLLKKIKIERVGDTDFLRVQCESESPLFSAFVVNALSEEFLRYDNSLKVSYSSLSIEFFEKLVSEKKKEYEQKQDLFNTFISSKGVISKEIESGAIMDQIKEYEIKKSTYASDIQRAKLSIADIDKRLGAAKKPTSPSNNNTNEKIVELRNKINQLNRLYTEGGSSDPEIEKELSNLRSQLQKALSSLANTESSGDETDAARRKRLLEERENFELELEIAENNYQSIQATIRNLRGAASGVANKEVALEALKKELDKANEEYLTALDRYNQERNKSLVSESTVRLIIKGQPSGHPEPSKRLLITALAGIASMIFTCFIIVLIEFLDQRLKNPSKFKGLVKIPLTGVLPRVKIKDFDLTELFSDSCRIKDNEIFREFLRKIRFYMEKESKQVFLITSTKQGEGKSFLIFCLAFSLSLIKKRILIIDTNFKNNTLTQMLLLKNSNQGKIDASSFFQAKLSAESHSSKAGYNKPNAPTAEDEYGYTDSIIARTHHPNIHIIGNQKGNASPSEIFAGKDFHKMISYLKSKYDVILMEGPAFNDFSDSRELVDFCEKVLVVFSAESSLSSIDKEGIDFMKKLNGKLMGAVLNQVEPDQIVN